MLLWLPKPEEDLFTRLWHRFQINQHRSSTTDVEKNKVDKEEQLRSNDEDGSKMGCTKQLCLKLTESSPLANGLLCMFLLSSALTMMGFAVPLVFMGEDGKDRGFKPSKAVFLFSIIALSDGIGR